MNRKSKNIQHHQTENTYKGIQYKHGQVTADQFRAVPTPRMNSFEPTPYAMSARGRGGPFVFRRVEFIHWMLATNSTTKTENTHRPTITNQREREREREREKERK